MRLKVYISDFLVRRGSDVNEEFFSQNSPIALVFKRIFGLSMTIHNDTVFWEDKDGYTHRAELPLNAFHWLQRFKFSKLEDRLKFDDLVFEIEIPNKGVDFYVRRAAWFHRGVKILQD